MVHGGIMRISELSRRTDTSIPTIKFYLREGLLPAGTPTARNQAEYGDEHVSRVLLIRTLTGVGRLSICSVRTVLDTLDQERDSDASRRAASLREASRRVTRLLDDLGWQVDRDGSEPAALCHLLHTLSELGDDHDLDLIERYARAAAHVARFERDLVKVPTTADADTVAARRTLFGVLVATMRRLAYDADAP
jgi:DNA-binding transcriptional MerR regulator